MKEVVVSDFFWFTFVPLFAVGAFLIGLVACFNVIRDFFNEEDN